jgi:enoyl-CoA hydratase/carnithine racemase
MKDAEAVSKKMDEESVEFRQRLASPEAKEAFAAFAERRAPDFGRV